MLYRLILRPILFLFDAEWVHDMTIALCGWLQKSPGALRVLSWYFHPVYAPVEVMGITLPNRVMLAAGFDKAGKIANIMQALGLGSGVVGSVPLRAQPGNPKPRLKRVPRRDDLLNHMGCNSPGAFAVRDNLEEARRGGSIPVGISLTCNTDTLHGQEATNLLESLRILYLLGDFFEVNISCRNTPAHRYLQNPLVIEKVLRALVEREKELAHRHGVQHKPILLKLAPDLSDEQLLDCVEAAVRADIDGVVLGNTSKNPHSVDAVGALSGHSLFDRMLEMVRLVHTTYPTLTIIACGGIDSPERAELALAAGAALVQIFTALVYKGPGIIRRIAHRLAHYR